MTQKFEFLPIAPHLNYLQIQFHSPYTPKTPEKISQNLKKIVKKKTAGRSSQKKLRRKKKPPALTLVSYYTCVHTVQKYHWSRGGCAIRLDSNEKSGNDEE